MSDLQRLLGIHPALWEVELKGMNDQQLSVLRTEMQLKEMVLLNLNKAIDDEKTRRKELPNITPETHPELCELLENATMESAERFPCEVLRPGATVRAKKDLRSMNGHPIKKGDEIRVTGFGEGLVTGQWGGLVVTVKESDVEVNR